MDTIVALCAFLKDRITSIQIYESTKRELTKTQGKMMVQTGEKQSYDKVIQILIKHWNEKT